MSFEARLRDVTTHIVDCPHTTPKWTDSGVLVLRNQNIKEGRLLMGNPSFTDDAHYHARIRRAVPQHKDIVLTREAPIGQLCQIPKGLKCCLGQRQVLIRPDSTKIDPDFLFYSMRAPFMQRQMLVIEGEGTTVSNLRISYIENLKLKVPSAEVQRKISALMRSLDDEADTLQHQNRALEATAQTLFRSWFVRFDPVESKLAGIAPEGMSAELAELFPNEFEDSELGRIPKGWRVGTLGAIGENSRAQLKPECMSSSAPYVGLEHVPRRSLALTSWGTADGLESNKFSFKHNDILFGKLRPYFHKVVFAPLAGVCSTDILVIRPKAPEWLALLALHLFSDAFIAHATQLSDGARMPRTNWKDTAAYKVAIPPISVSGRFTEIVAPLVNCIHNNIALIRALENLRDHLLPRLISGKLSLEEAQETVEELIPA